MTRVVQPEGVRGSLRWIQTYVNDRSEALDEALASASAGRLRTPVEWRSPVRGDEYAEYRDQSFLDLLGVELPVRKLEEYWPRRGPQWDALGLTASGQPVLVEAKANIPEVISPGTASSDRSQARIQQSLAETADFLGVKSSCDWSGTFYQYANRLAHLYLLTEVNRIDAWLLFVYFVGDADVGGPTTVREWEAALQVLHGALGLGKRHRLASRVQDVFVDVRGMTTAAHFP